MVDRRFSWLELAARPALFPALLFALGALLGPQPLFSGTIFLGAACLAGLVGMLLRRRTGGHLLVLLGFLLAGLGLSSLEADIRGPPDLLQGRSAVVVEAEVTSVSRFPDGARLDVAVTRLWPANEGAQQVAPGVPVRFGARLYGRGEGWTVPEPGQRLRVPVTLKPLEPPLNPGQPDFRDKWLRRGVVVTGGFDPRRMVVLTAPAPHRTWQTETHAALAERVRALSPTPEAAALYLTLAAGLRAELGDDLEERFSASGLAHVLSVSGLHVAILAVLLLRVLRSLLARVGPLARRMDVRRVAAPLAVPLMWGYVAFTGWQMPAVRSAVMATAVLLGLALWRRADGVNGLALAAMALVAWDPASVADLSTRLSFLAVASLLVVTPALRKLVPVPSPTPGLSGWRRRLAELRENVIGVFCGSAAVTMSSAPLIAHVFQRLSFAGLVSNVVCLPLCGLLTVLAAGGAGLFVIEPVLATPVLWAGAWASQALLWAVDFFAAMPGATVRVASFGVWAGSLFLVGLFAWAVFRDRLRWVGIAAPAALVLGIAVPRLAHEPGLSVTFLGVGHGDAVVLSSRGHHALVDAGGSVGGVDTGRRYVLPYLRDRRIERFDLAVLSHPHADHALGMISTLEAVPAGRFWHAAGEADAVLTKAVREAAVRGGAQVEEVEAGHAPLKLGEATVEVLWPPADRILLEGTNDRSVVLRVRHGAVTFLLAGDIEEAAEEALEPGPVTVVKAPHHGSKTSSTDEFVEKLRPKIAVFCVGRHHRWNFPDEGVVERYRDVGSQCYRTDRHGAVTVESDGRDVKVRTFLRPGGQAEETGVAAVAARPHPDADDP